MAGRELIVASNPAKRRTSAAQRAAARRNIKKAQAARRRKSGTRTTKRRRNPTAAKTRAKAPTRRRAVRRTAAKRRTYRNPTRAKLIPKNLVDRQLMPALIGGGGAVLNDSAYSVVMSRLAGMLPGTIGMQLSAGPLRHAGKAGSALLMTYLASFVLNRKTAEQMGAGALTVVGYNIVRELAERFAPQIPLGAYIEPGLGWASPGTSGASGMLNPRTGSNLGVRSGLAAYVRPDRARTGLSAVPQLSTRGQLTMPDPFTPASRSPALEGYGGYG